MIERCAQSFNAILPISFKKRDLYRCHAMDRQTDGTDVWMDRQSDSYIAPTSPCGGGINMTQDCVYMKQNRSQLWVCVH